MKKLLALLLFVSSFAFGGSVTGQITTATSGPIVNGTLTFSLTQSAVQAGTASIATSAVSCYTDRGGNIVSQPDPLVAPIVTTNTGSGTLAAGTYFTEFTYYDASGTSLASFETTTVLSSTGTLIVAPPVRQPATATGWKIFISSTSGTETLQSTQTGFSSSYQQSSALAAGSALPSSNTSVCKVLFNDQLIPSGTGYNVGFVNASGSNISGFPQKWFLSGGAAGTVNVSNGTPLYSGTVQYPQAIVSSPGLSAQQSINGPLNLNGFGLTAGTLGVTGTTTLAGTAIPVIGIDPTSSTYGCSTALTDNSTCMQAAINAAINTNTCLILPLGVFKYATTLNANIGINGLCMKGKGMQPNVSGNSILRYMGSGDAILISNGGNAFTFASNWEDVVIQAGANAANAVHAIDLSEFTFRRVGIWNDFLGHQFTTAWNCAGCNIGAWDGWIVANATNAVRLTDTPESPSASLTFLHADTFQVTNIFVIDGQGNNIADIAGWHETQNVVLLIDDTSKTTGLQAIYFDNTRSLFNGAIATYPDSLFMKVNNVAGKIMALHQVNFDHSTYFTNQTVAYPMTVTMANASSALWLGIGGNCSFQGATTGLLTSSLVAQSQLKLNTYGYESVNASFAALGTFVGGSGAQNTQYEYTGITGNGGITLNSATSFVAVGVNPAASGVVRVPNNVAIAARNAANNADVNLVFLDGSNQVNFGATAVDPTAFVAPQLFSTIATGSLPLVITSTTPVPNLNSSPITRNAAGTQQVATHIVKDTCTLGTSCSVTLAGSSVFTSNATYDCFPRDATTPANAVTVTRTSGSALAFTGTGTDVINYVCVGN
ncbi:MAG TPA: hypothetical protein VGP89_17965 [Candidatus Angelobacter sp.]|jgi:hypothetical protein|nr:hypothetical protein [Candidatus Angelobacter sp.]